MKKLIAIILIIMLLITMSACGNVESIDYTTMYESIEEAVEGIVNHDVEIIDYIRNQSLLIVTFIHKNMNGITFLYEKNNKYFGTNGSIIMTEGIKVLDNGEMWVIGNDRIGGEYYLTVALDKEYNVKIGDIVLEKMKFGIGGFLYYYIYDKKMNSVEVQIDEEVFLIEW